MEWNELQLYLTDANGWNWPAVILGSVAAALLIKLVLTVLVRPLRRLSKKTGFMWDDVLADIIDGLKWPVLLVWCANVFAQYRKPEATHKILLVAAVVVGVYQVSLWGLYVIRRWRESFVSRRVKQDPSASAALGLMFVSVQTIFIVIVVLIGLSNLGVDIGALLAGLGVGGVAVALAAQNVLGDLLASLSIVLDKPFKVGDFILVGEDMGTVENIGIKTTRLRSLSGEELVFSNRDLLDSRVRNYKRMWQRRVVHTFSVRYGTPLEKVAAVPGWVKTIVEQTELSASADSSGTLVTESRAPVKVNKVKFDRCHLSLFGESSLNYELVFWVNDPDYNIYMDLQQGILLRILEKFAAEKVEFALPARSLYIERKPSAEKDAPENRLLPDSGHLLNGDGGRHPQ